MTEVMGFNVDISMVPSIPPSLNPSLLPAFFLTDMIYKKNITIVI